MADVFRNGLGYFFQGVKDCLYGIIRIYEFQKSVQDDDTQEQKKPLSVLAQRRAAATSASSDTQKSTKKSRSARLFV